MFLLGFVDALRSYFESVCQSLGSFDLFVLTGSKPHCGITQGLWYMSWQTQLFFSIRYSEMCKIIFKSSIKRQELPCGLRPSFNVGHREPWPRRQLSLHFLRIPTAVETPSPLPALAPHCGRWRSHCPQSC